MAERRASLGLLEMNLVRLLTHLSIDGTLVEPKRIHAVVECEESVQARKLMNSFICISHNMPPSWERARPMVAWRPVKIRLTQFGLETKSTLGKHARLKSSETCRILRRWHFICGDIVAVRHRKS